MKNKFTMRKKPKSKTLTIMKLCYWWFGLQKWGGKFLRVLNDYNLANRCYRKYMNQNVIDYTLCKASRDLKKGDFSNFFYERMQSLGVLVDECKQIYDALRLLLSLLRKYSKVTHIVEVTYASTGLGHHIKLYRNYKAFKLYYKAE